MSGRPTGSASGGSMTRRPRRTRLVAGLAGMAMVASLVAVATTTAAPANAANTTTDLQVQVESGRDAGTYATAIKAGDKVEDWSYVLQRIEAGDPHQSAQYCLPPVNDGTTVTNPDGSTVSTFDKAYPNNCQWPGTRESNTGDPIISSGNQVGVSVVSTTTGGEPIKITNLPEGHDYIISIKANGFEIGGAQFHSPMSGPITVKLNPGALPLATVRIRVFEDMAPVDGTYEIDAEPGLGGFRAYLSDMLGDVSTDFYGNPLCTRYVHKSDGSMDLDPTGSPTIAPNNPGTGCLSDAQTGDIEIPNMAPGRYGITVRQPSGKTDWYQTTTLEGATDHDWWVMAGDTGWGTETTYGGEPVPEVQFGFVPPRTTSTSLGSSGGVTLSALGTASISGSVHFGCHYIGSPGGMVANAAPGVAGPETKDCGPIANGVVAVSALDLGDQVVATAETSSTGAFSVPNLANGSYMLAFFDKTMTAILEVNNVTITNGQSENVGTAFLSSWFAKISGYVFVDDNGNGKRDPGEPGVQSSALTVRERDNTPMDQFTNLIDTDVNGHYTIDQAYPLARFLILEHVNSRYRPTGYTVRSCNDTETHTYTGAAVDISVMPVLGLCAEVDWAVYPIPSDETDGIAGTISYGTTRNELDPADGVTEDWQPGIPNIPVNLYAAIICGTEAADLPDYKNAGSCADGPGKPMKKADGSAVRGPKLADYLSETYHRPQGCTALDRNGNPLTDQKALPAFPAAAGLPLNGNETLECVESNMLGTQAKPQDGTESTPDNPFPGDNAQEVNGNYGFGTSSLNLYAPSDPRNPGDPATGNPLPLFAPLADYGIPDQALIPGDYLVSITIPKDSYGDPMYKVTKEEDVNIFSGDEFAPQENFPLSSATEAGDPTPGSPLPIDSGAGVTSSCVGPNHLVDVPNADNITKDDFVAGGGSPFQGQQRPLCTDKLVELQGGSTGATNFELFTDVPLATHFWGLLINDIGLQTDPKSIGFDEAEGIPNVPTGIYDWAGNLVTTADSDRNGFYEAVVPSSDRINNPSPTGVSPNMYRFVGNDPGVPGHLNKNYNPRYRTIATNFQAWPGLWTVTDTAPTAAASNTFTNGSWVQTVCDVTTGEPELFAVSNPVANVTSGYADVTITGQGFGSGSAGVHQVLLSGPDGSATDPTTWTPLTATSWTSTSITVRIPQASDSFLPGARSLAVMNNGGQRSTQGISLQVLGTGGGSTYDPQQLHVGPGQTYGTIQDALDAALAAGATASTLVVVHPGTATATTPRGEYAENPVIGSGVRLQGYGPGGWQGSTWVDGSIITGEAFAEGSQTGTNWNATVLATPHAVDTIDVPDAATITVLSPPNGTGTSKPAIDGFRITGGHEQNLPTNISVLTNTQNTPYGAPGAVITQGGGIYVHGGSDGLAISNNVIEGNSGAYAGGIRVGTPYANGSVSRTTPITGYAVSNTNLSIAHNRVLHNGGSNLAGAIGLFSGSEGYKVSYNDVCGNFSAEYGGGISQYGLSKQARIDHNRIWYNQSYDHGGGILLGGELMQNPSALSLGTGDVTVSDNRIAQNTSNDDAGGLDLLNVTDWRVLIQNNEIVNNVSAHEGGGIAVTDSSNAVIVNSTIARNITTATANTSNGLPAPAGIAIAAMSPMLKARLNTSDNFRAPLMFNDILWDNRAGTYDGITVKGIGNPPDATAVTTWDVGSIDGAGPFAVTSSVITPAGATNKNQITASGTNSPANPLFVSAVLPGIQIDARRAFGVFRQAIMLDQTQSPWNTANYAVTAASTARSRGAASATTTIGAPTTVTAPVLDIDSFGRTNPNTAGSWEYRTGYAKPTAPTNLAVAAGNGSLVLSWAPPASTGGLPLTAYNVTVTGGASTPTSCTTVPPNTGCTFTGMTNGTPYTFSVTASNALGASPVATVTGTPGAANGISGVTLTATGANSLRVSWTTPVPAGRVYRATAYTAATAGQQISNNSFCEATTTGATSCNIQGFFTGLNLRTTPAFVSVASRAASPANSPFTAPTPRIALPTSPRSVIAHRVEVTPQTNPRTVNLYVGWTAPSSLGTGAAITGYTVRAYSSLFTSTLSGTCTTTTALSCTITLPRGTSTNGTAYAVEVTATTAVGSSWPSTRTSSDTNALPGAPTGVAATSGNARAFVTWTAPADQLVGPVTNYQIRYSSNGGPFITTPITVGSAATSFTVTGLTNNRLYVFEVRARNAGSSTYGPWSDPSTALRVGTPPVPTGVTVTGGNSTQDAFTGGTLVVTWTQPTGTTAAVTSSRVQVWSSATSSTVVRSCTAAGTAVTCTVTGLARATHYWVSVSARNSVGRSAESAPRVPGVTT